MAPEDLPGNHDEARRLWREWARSIGPAHLAELAPQAAIDLLQPGASVPSAVAAAHIAASIGTVRDAGQLQAELAWIQSVIDDLERQGAPKTLVDRYRTRH